MGVVKTLAALRGLKEVNGLHVAIVNILLVSRDINFIQDSGSVLASLHTCILKFSRGQYFVDWFQKPENKIFVGF